MIVEEAANCRITIYRGSSDAALELR